MTKELTYRGPHTILPIAGYEVVKLCVGLSGFPELHFKAAEEGEATLEIHDQLSLKRGVYELILRDSDPSVRINPKDLAPLLELLGSSVEDAVAEKEGRLTILFSNKLMLEVSSSHGYEAWHFYYSHGNRFVSLHGADGYLI